MDDIGQDRRIGRGARAGPSIRLVLNASRNGCCSLAEHEDLFPDEDFPPPGTESSSLMYRIAQDGDRLALYIQTVGKPGEFGHRRTSTRPGR